MDHPAGLLRGGPGLGDGVYAPGTSLLPGNGFHDEPVVRSGDVLCRCRGPIKALSPAINDPTTAVQALDQVEDMLLRLGRHRLEIGRFHDDQGRRRLVVPCPTWEDFLLLALDEIRAYGAESVQVMRRMKALITNLITVLPVERHAALRHWEKRLQGSIARSFADAEEQRDASVADRQGLGIGPEESSGT